MNKDYERAMKIIVDFGPNAAEMLLQYSEVEQVQYKQFFGFLTMLQKGERDKNYEANINEFLESSNYLDENGRVDFKPLLEQLYEGYEEFSTSYKHLIGLFQLSLENVLNSKGLFKNNMTVEKGDAFLDSIGYLLAIRTKCLCYVAATALLNEKFPYIQDESMRKSFLEDEYGMKVIFLPNYVRAMIYTELFLSTGLFMSK